MSRRVASDAGETLIEILIAVAIMGIVMVGLVAGLTTATVASDSHRRLSDVEIVARSYGEAVVNKALHPLSTTLTAPFAAAPNNDTVTVASTAGFVKDASVSVDGEVLVIKNAPVGSTITFTSDLVADHAAGTMVSLYQPCPDRAALELSGFSTSALRIGTPSITQIEYFDQPAAAGATPALVAAWTGTGSPPGTCSNFWDTTGKPCSLNEAPRPHYTACDPPLLRITLTVASTEASGNARSSSTTTRVFVNRSNA